MFRIKPVRNQTNAKYTYHNNNQNNIININQPNSNNQQQSKLTPISKPIVNQVINPQKPSHALLKKVNPTLVNTNQQHKVTFVRPPAVVSHQKTVLKRTVLNNNNNNNNQHKIKIPTTNPIPSKLIQSNGQQQHSLIKATQNKKQLLINVQKQDQKLPINKNHIKQQKIQIKPLQIKASTVKQITKQQPIIKIPLHKIIQNQQEQPYSFRNTQKQHQQKINKQKQHQQNINKQQQQPSIIKNQQNKKVEQHPINNPQPVQQQKPPNNNDRQQQMQDLVIKIQKRRQARQKQKLKLKQMQQKRKQNQQRALQFMNQRNIQNGQNNLNNQGMSGMLQLNDQLMHFSLAESIMDLQIKKLLKTNFSQFPNYSQIKYLLEELQRISISYEMVRMDDNNLLRNGLKNYRVEIFNRIGEEIIRAQTEGYSNANFHIMQHDGRVNQLQSSVIPQALRGVPIQSMDEFMKFVKNDRDEECTICLGEIILGDLMARLQCGHGFHVNCIKEWVGSSANCPSCRFNIKFGNNNKRG